MSEDLSTQRPATPWHLWVIGIVGLLWSAFGAYDYLMTQTQNEAYMSQFSPEALEYFYSFPAWVVATWALAVWGEVAGVILLLLRKAVAAPVLLVSFVCLILNSVYSFVLSDGLEIMGTTGALFTLVIFIVALGLWLYARAMARRGVLA